MYTLFISMFSSCDTGKVKWRILKTSAEIEVTIKIYGKKYRNNSKCLQICLDDILQLKTQGFAYKNTIGIFTPLL